MELNERATEAEKGNLRSQIAAVEAEKRALEAEGKGVADRLTNLQASYDGLVRKLAEANATLEAFAPCAEITEMSAFKDETEHVHVLRIRVRRSFVQAARLSIS